MIQTARTLLLIFSILFVAISPLTMAAPSTQVYLPLVMYGQASFNGIWIGTLTQPNKTFNFALDISQTGTTVHGTTTIHDQFYFATMTVQGSLNQEGMTLNEIAIVNSNSASSGIRWCIKRIDLTQKLLGDHVLLEGTWQEPGCNAGYVYLQGPITTFPIIAGSWKGTLSQSNKVFSFELSLTQDRNTIQGTSRIQDGSDYAIMNLQGFSINQQVILQEVAVIEGNASNWCIKTLTMSEGLTSNPTLLSGTWSALGCNTGNVQVLKQ